MKKSHLYLFYSVFFVFFLIITFSSIVYLYEKKNFIFTTIKKTVKTLINDNYHSYNDEIWAKKILEGGYILHFRHAERDKWIDIKMYDAMESDLHDNGNNGSRYAESDYFEKAVCLNERGKIQARAMSENIRHSNLPISYVVTSVSCRARQTADLAFGGYNAMNRLLVHEGPYKEIDEERINNIKVFYLSLPYNPKSNVIVSSHNGVIRKEMFDNEIPFAFQNLSLEEGGFFIISNKNEKLTFEYEFHNFSKLTKIFYER